MNDYLGKTNYENQSEAAAWTMLEREQLLQAAVARYGLTLTRVHDEVILEGDETDIKAFQAEFMQQQDKKDT